MFYNVDPRPHLTEQIFGATTLYQTAVSIMTLSEKALSIMAISILTFSIMSYNIMK